MIISLTGFMGSGKTSVGQALAAELGCAFVDLDVSVEERSGRSLQDIFTTDGEAGFRVLELEALRAALASEANMVLALGGGTILSAEAAALVRENTTCIYLSTSATELTRRLLSVASGRPLISDAATDEETLKVRVKTLLTPRKPFYEAAAVMMVTTDGRPSAELAHSLAAFFQARLSS